MISRFWEATTAKRMKIDSYCLRHNCSPLNVAYTFPAMYDYIDRAGRSSAKGCQTGLGRGKQATFYQNASISETLGDTTKLLLMMKFSRHTGSTDSIVTNTD